jgi:predicted O-methyltransferase YrrM
MRSPWLLFALSSTARATVTVGREVAGSLSRPWLPRRIADAPPLRIVGEAEVDARAARAAAMSSAEPESLAAIRAECAAALPAAAHMMSGPAQGRLLALLSRLAGSSRTLEIGTFVGYASIWLAGATVAPTPTAAAVDGASVGRLGGVAGELVTCERDERAAEIARRSFARAGYALVAPRAAAADPAAARDADGRERWMAADGRTIELRIGLAAETLASLAQDALAAADASAGDRGGGIGAAAAAARSARGDAPSRPPALPPTDALPPPAPFGFAFIDADKKMCLPYIHTLLESPGLLRAPSARAAHRCEGATDGGAAAAAAATEEARGEGDKLIAPTLIAVDNVLFRGLVLDCADAHSRDAAAEPRAAGGGGPAAGGGRAGQAAGEGEGERATECAGAVEGAPLLLGADGATPFSPPADSRQAKLAAALHAFNRAAVSDPRLETLLLPMRDGILLCWQADVPATDAPAPDAPALDAPAPDAPAALASAPEATRLALRARAVRPAALASAPEATRLALRARAVRPAALASAPEATRLALRARAVRPARADADGAVGLGAALDAYAAAHTRTRAADAAAAADAASAGGGGGAEAAPPHARKLLSALVGLFALQLQPSAALVECAALAAAVASAAPRARVGGAAREWTQRAASPGPAQGASVELVVVRAGGEGARAGLAALRASGALSDRALVAFVDVPLGGDDGDDDDGGGAGAGDAARAQTSVRGSGGPGDDDAGRRPALGAEAEAFVAGWADERLFLPICGGVCLAWRDALGAAG